MLNSWTFRTPLIFLVLLSLSPIFINGFDGLGTTENPFIIENCTDLSMIPETYYTPGISDPIYNISISYSLPDYDSSSKTNEMVIPLIDGIGVLYSRDSNLYWIDCNFSGGDCTEDITLPNSRTNARYSIKDNELLITWESDSRQIYALKTPRYRGLSTSASKLIAPAYSLIPSGEILSNGNVAIVYTSQAGSYWALNMSICNNTLEECYPVHIQNISLPSSAGYVGDILQHSNNNIYMVYRNGSSSQYLMYKCDIDGNSCEYTQLIGHTVPYPEYCPPIVESEGGQIFYMQHLHQINTINPDLTNDTNFYNPGSYGSDVRYSGFLPDGRFYITGEYTLGNDAAFVRIISRDFTSVNNTIFDQTIDHAVVGSGSILDNGAFSVVYQSASQYLDLAVTNILSVLPIGMNYPIYEINNNIDCSGIDLPYNDITFKGEIRGNNHTISNLIKISNNTGGGYNHLLMENANNATFRDIRFNNLQSLNNNRVASNPINGLLISTLDNVSFNNIIITDSILSCNRAASECERYGFFGGSATGDVNIKNSAIINSTMDGTIRSGGFIGQVEGLSINEEILINHSFVKNFYLNAPIDYTYQNPVSLGLLIGYLNSNLSIYDSYGTGIINQSSTRTCAYHGGLFGTVKNIKAYNIYSDYSHSPCSTGTPQGVVGQFTTTDIFDSGVYFDNETLGFNSCSAYGSFSDCKGVSDNDMKIQSTFTEFDFISTWGINEGLNDPFLLWHETPIPICNMSFTWLNVSLGSVNYELFDNMHIDFIDNSLNFTYEIINLSEDWINNITIKIINTSSDIIYYSNTSTLPEIISPSNAFKLSQNNPFIITAQIYYNNEVCITTDSIIFNISDVKYPNCTIFNSVSLNEENLPELIDLSFSCNDDTNISGFLYCPDLINHTFYNEVSPYNYINLSEINNSLSCNITVIDEYSNNITLSRYFTIIPYTAPPAVDVTPISNSFLNVSLLFLWVVLMVLTLTLKGRSGKTIQLINILQMVFAFVVGSIWMGSYFLLGFPIIMVGIGLFIGLIMNDRL